MGRGVVGEELKKRKKKGAALKGGKVESRTCRNVQEGKRADLLREILVWEILVPA